MSSNPAIAQFDHFIPVSTSELIRQLEQDPDYPLAAQHRAVMHRLNRILSFRFYQTLVAIKQLYAPLNPDSDLLPAAGQQADAAACIEQLRGLLVNANYTELDEQQIQYALQKTSPYGLEIGIDFDAFAHVSLFYRGKSQSSVQVRDWKSLFLRKKSTSLIHYRRLFLVLQFRDGSDKPGLHLKLFKDIPRPDLEMLFPDCKLRIKLFDKIKLAITGGGGTAGGLFATIGKVTAAVSPWTILIAIAGFAALLWRQISKIFVQKTRYMATLAKNLYFHNLDNNVGAITYLIDQARQEEIKETILAYALLGRGDIRKREQLDDVCEQWFAQRFDAPIDFDIDDAMRKLEAFGLLQNDNTGLSCADADRSIRELDRTWRAFLDDDPQE